MKGENAVRINKIISFVLALAGGGCLGIGFILYPAPRATFWAVEALVFFFLSWWLEEKERNARG